MRGREGASVNPLSQGSASSNSEQPSLPMDDVLTDGSADTDEETAAANEDKQPGRMQMTRAEKARRGARKGKVASELFAKKAKVEAAALKEQQEPEP